MHKGSNTPHYDVPPYSRSIQTDPSQQTKDERRNGMILERTPLFSGILPCDQSKLLAAARLKEFARGEMLHSEGDPVDQIILLTRGLVKITQLGMRGAEVILRLSVPGDVVGAVSLFSTGKHCTTAQAFRACHSLVWDAALFKSAVERLPALHRNLVCIVVANLEELEERFREVATERVAPRVACQLVRLAERIGRSVNGAIEIGVSREELAQMTGTTLFTVSRLLSAWEERGLVRPLREAVAVCDMQSLISIGERD